MRSIGKRGEKVYTVLLRGKQVFCSCRDYKETRAYLQHARALIKKGLAVSGPLGSGKLPEKLYGSRLTGAGFSGRLPSFSAPAPLRSAS